MSPSCTLCFLNKGPKLGILFSLFEFTKYTKRNGIVVTPPDDKGMCFVQAGIMKTKIDVKKLRLVEKQQPAKTPQKQQTKKKHFIREVLFLFVLMTLTPNGRRHRYDVPGQHQ